MTPLDNPPEPVTLRRRTLLLRPTFPPGGTPEGILPSALRKEAAACEVTSPGTVPVPDRRAISARTAPSHFISSSSVGAQRSSVRLVVTILNV